MFYVNGQNIFFMNMTNNYMMHLLNLQSLCVNAITQKLIACSVSTFKTLVHIH